MAEHILTITAGTWIGGLHAEVTCNAVPGSPCRMTCPQGCEEWRSDHGEEYGPDHALADNGACLAVEWFEAEEDGPGSCCGMPEDAPVRTGPIRVWWDGDNWLWECIDEPDPTLLLPLDLRGEP